MDLDSSPPLGFVSFLCNCEEFLQQLIFIFTSRLCTYYFTQFCLLHFKYCSKSFGKSQVLSPSSFPINSKQMKLLFFDQRNRALKGGNIWKKNYVLITDNRLSFPLSHERATQMFSFLLPFFSVKIVDIK